MQGWSPRSKWEEAAPTFRRDFDFHAQWASLDNGYDGTGEPLALPLRKGGAGSNTAADHLTVLKAALARLPGGHTLGKKALVRVRPVALMSRSPG